VSSVRLVFVGLISVRTLAGYAGQPVEAIGVHLRPCALARSDPDSVARCLWLIDLCENSVAL